MITGLSDIEAIEATPLSARCLPRNTYEMIRLGGSRNPDAPALSFFLQSADHDKPFVLSHRQLGACITQAANLFRRLGIGRGDVVAFVLPNLPETHYTIWGGETAGIVFAINPLLETPQIAELLRAGRAKWLVTLGPAPGVDLWGRVASAAAEAPGLQGVLAVSIAPYVRGAAGVAMRAAAVLRKPSSPGLNVPVLDFGRELAREADDALKFAPPQPFDVSSYFCTGGTTGLPKIAVRTQFSEVLNAWGMGRFLPGAAAPGKNIFCGLPLFHVNGQLVTGLFPWAEGAHVILGTPQGYRGAGVIDRFWEIVERHRIHFFSGVPTVYSTLLQKPIGGRDVGSLEYGLCGAAPMPVEVFRQFQERTGIRILEGYGLTEGACASSVNPPGAPARIGSIGIRYPYQDMRILVLDDDGRYLRDAGVDEPGAVALKGPNVFAGYLDPAHNTSVWIDRPGKDGIERWLNTGDLGRCDADGYFWLTGRKKELIIRGGHNIDPKLIEEPLHEHPAVALAAAVGRPDAHAGEVPVAYVQLRDGQQIGEAELLRFTAEQVHERAAQPKYLRIVDSLPTTPVGKIFKPALAMREIEDVVRTEARIAGAALRMLEVVQDRKHGLLARIAVDDAGHDQLREALGRYAFARQFID